MCIRIEGLKTAPLDAPQGAQGLRLRVRSAPRRDQNPQFREQSMVKAVSLLRGVVCRCIAARAGKKNNQPKIEFDPFLKKSFEKTPTFCNILPAETLLVLSSLF